jgi:nicotinamide-nucleotide amidase
MFPPDLIARAAALIARYRAAGLMAATAESCTGGLIAGLLTEIPGSSNVLERGFVVYSNEAKEELLGVPAETLASHGAVSEETARAMAEGALKKSHADVAVSVTGIAGPDGGTAQKPFGLVHFACARRGAPTVAREERFGDIGREAVRLGSNAFTCSARPPGTRRARIPTRRGGSALAIALRRAFTPGAFADAGVESIFRSRLSPRRIDASDRIPSNPDFFTYPSFASHPTRRAWRAIMAQQCEREQS